MSCGCHRHYKSPTRTDSMGRRLRFSNEELSELQLWFVSNALDGKMSDRIFIESMGLSNHGFSTYLFQRMFDVMDVNNDHLITLPDYLNFMDKQLHGTEEVKYSLSFKIFDVNKSGTVSKDEFSQMIKNICAMYASLLNSPMTIDEWVIDTTFKKLDPTERGLFDEREYQIN